MANVKSSRSLPSLFAPRWGKGHIPTDPSFSMSVPRSPYHDPPLVAQAAEVVLAAMEGHGEANAMVEDPHRLVAPLSHSGSTDSSGKVGRSHGSGNSPAAAGVGTKVSSSFYVSPRIHRVSPLLGRSPPSTTSGRVSTDDGSGSDGKSTSSTASSHSFAVLNGEAQVDAALDAGMAPVRHRATSLPRLETPDTGKQGSRSSSPGSIESPPSGVPTQADKRVKLGRSIGNMLKGLIGGGDSPSSSLPSPSGSSTGPKRTRGTNPTTPLAIASKSMPAYPATGVVSSWAAPPPASNNTQQRSEVPIGTGGATLHTAAIAAAPPLSEASTTSSVSGAGACGAAATARRHSWLGSSGTLTPPLTRSESQSTGSVGTMLPPPVTEYNEVEEAAAAATLEATLCEQDVNRVKAYVSRTQKVVLDAFHVTAGDIEAAMLAEARRSRKLRALLTETKRRLVVAENRQAAGLPPLSVPGLALPNRVPPGFREPARRHGTMSGGSSSRFVDSSAGSSPMLPRIAVHVDARTTFKEYAVALDDAILEDVDRDTVAAMNVGWRIRTHDDQFRLMIRALAHMPAFLSLVLFQRVVEQSALADMSAALLLTEVRELRARLAAVTAGYEPLHPVSSSGVWMAYVASCTENEIADISPIATGLASPNGFRKGADLPSYGGYGDDYDATAGLPTPTPPSMPLDAAQVRSPYHYKILAPASPHESYLRRAYDRIRESLRLKCLEVSICVLDFSRVWHPSLDEKRRQFQFLPLLTPSPDPLVLSTWLKYRTTLKKRVHRHNEGGDGASLAPALGFTASLAPSLSAVRHSVSSSDSGDVTSRAAHPAYRQQASIGLPHLRPSSAVVTLGRNPYDKRAASTASILQSTEFESSSARGHGHAATPQASNHDRDKDKEARRLSSVTIARLSLLDFGYTLWEHGIFFPQRTPVLIPGHGLPRGHCVHMEDLAPCIESLVDRHPDLSRVRDHPMLKRRFITCACASVFGSLVGGHSVHGVPINEVLDSNLVDSLYICSTGHTVTIVPFSNKHFEELSEDFEAARELTDHTDSRAALPRMHSTGGSLLSPGRPTSIRLSRSVSRDVATPTAKCSPGKFDFGFDTLAGLTPLDVFGVDDPAASFDDHGTTTMAALASQCDVQISNAMLERVFAGRARPLMSGMRGRMSFEDYVWFACYQTDRMHMPSLVYWSRCLDLDDDGILSPIDLECAYEAKAWQIQEAPDRESMRGIVSSKHILAAIADLIDAEDPSHITALDIRRSGAGHILFDILLALKGSPASRNFI